MKKQSLWRIGHTLEKTDKVNAHNIAFWQGLKEFTNVLTGEDYTVQAKLMTNYSNFHTNI